MGVVAVASYGLDQAEALLERTADRLARLPVAAGQPAPRDDVDISAEMVTLLETHNYFQINTRVLKAAFEVEEHLLDVLG